jgi:hypothetical protein
MMRGHHLHSVQGEDYGDHTTGRTCVECVLEMRHSDDCSHQRSIVSIGTSATEGNKDRVCPISM